MGKKRWGFQWGKVASGGGMFLVGGGITLVGWFAGVISVWAVILAVVGFFHHAERFDGRRRSLVNVGTQSAMRDRRCDAFSRDVARVRSQAAAGQRGEHHANRVGGSICPAKRSG